MKHFWGKCKGARLVEPLDMLDTVQLLSEALTGMRLLADPLDVPGNADRPVGASARSCGSADLGPPAV